MTSVLPTSEPTLRGAMGNAWAQDIDGFLAKHPEQESMRLSSVGGYLVHAAYAHPAWHSYMIACVNLRDIPGVPPAKINMPGATHEILVYALDPNTPMFVDESPALLHPANFHGQFIEPSDEAAAERMKQTVQDVIDGKLNPDTDYGQLWIRRFSASNIKGDPAKFGETRIVATAPDGAVVADVTIPPKTPPQDMH